MQHRESAKQKGRVEHKCQVEEFFAIEHVESTKQKIEKNTCTKYKRFLQCNTLKVPNRRGSSTQGPNINSFLQCSFLKVPNVLHCKTLFSLALFLIPSFVSTFTYGTNLFYFSAINLCFMFNCHMLEPLVLGGTSAIWCCRQQTLLELWA